MRSALSRQSWWLKRLGVLPVHVLGFAVVVFFVVRALPGDPVLTMTQGQISPQQLDEARRSLGLTGSVPSQLWSFLSDLVHLDLGKSIGSGRPVWQDISQRLPATLELVVIGLGAVAVCSTLAALIAITRPAGIASRMIRGYANAAGAIPQFVVGVTFIFVFYAKLGWAPAPIGRFDPALGRVTPITNFPLLDATLRLRFDVVSSTLAHLALPLIVLVIVNSAVLVKLLVRGLDDALASPETRFRAASGAPRKWVLLSVFRRALPPVATAFGAMFGGTIGGLVIMEQLFGLGGMGQYAVDAIDTADVIAIRGFLIVMAAVCLAVFMVTDLVNMLLDPRRRPGAAAKATP